VRATVRLCGSFCPVLRRRGFASGQSGPDGEGSDHLVVGRAGSAGAEKWMADTVKAYQAAHPQVSFQTVLQSTEDLVPAFDGGRRQAGTGHPVLLGRGLTLRTPGPGAWCRSATTFRLPSTSTSSATWSGSTTASCGHGLVPVGNSIAYRKHAFKKAGLNEGNHVPWAFSRPAPVEGRRVPPWPAA
jgi:hypothetical protein